MPSRHARRAYTSGTMTVPVRDRTETLERLAELQPQLRALGVVSLRLFGSAGRDAMDATSDVDLLVEFQRPVGAFEFLDVRELLADALGRPVDLVTPAAVKPWMRERVERETVRGLMTKGCSEGP